MSGSIPDYLTVVSGLPRSGTSMMMKMLETGGMHALCDGVRTADDDNPKGYYEYEPVKRTKQDSSWVDQGIGSVVKMVYQLVYDLPKHHTYRVLCMRRNMDEIMAQVSRGGLRVAQVPVNHYPRYHGEQSGANLRVITKAFRELPQLWKYRKCDPIRPSSGVATSADEKVVATFG